jgi:predicted amidohydrolase YtcJ
MLADMVLLDRNPLEVDPSDIAGIKPMGTITDGRVVWQK